MQAAGLAHTLEVQGTLTGEEASKSKGGKTMASRRMGVFALASACLAASLALSDVPAIATSSQAAPATSATADETLGDEGRRL